MKTYRVSIYWEPEEVEVQAKSKKEAEEKARQVCNMEPNVDNVQVW